MQITLFTALKSIKMTDKNAKSVVDTIDHTIDRRIELSIQSLKSEMSALRSSLETRMMSIEAQMISLQESVRLQLNIITMLIAVFGLIGATAPIWSRFIP